MSDEGNSIAMSAVYGRVELGDSVEVTLPSGDGSGNTFTLLSTHYRWRPPAAFGLPDEQCPALTELMGGSGLRQFAPSAGTGNFLLQASVAGHEILKASGRLTPEAGFSYHAMRLIYQRAPRIQENLCRSFHRARDLYVSTPERTASDATDILPDDLGLHVDGTGQKWSVTELMDCGRRAAVEAGHEQPTAAVCIRTGLLEAARRNPIDIDQLNEAEALSLVRTALFDLGPAQPLPSESTIERVLERLLRALKPHIDDTTEEFHVWFYDHADDLVRRIAKQKKCGGPIARDEVRQAMLEIIFRSFTYLGDCIHILMRDFAAALPKPLSEPEKALFDVLYLKHAWLGGLPLILLVDQFRNLREILLEIIKDPTKHELRGVLLRQLQFQATMVRNKRESEKHYKRQRADGMNHNELTNSLDACAATQTSILASFQEIAAELRERRDARCPCATHQAWEAALHSSASNPAELVFHDECHNCGHLESVTISVAEARQILQALRS